jgi:hypothetical protein
MSQDAYANLIKGEPGLVSYWRLGETSGPAVDQTGRNPGTTISGVSRGSQNSLLYDDGSGLDGSGYANGGSGAYIKVPYGSSMDVGAKLSVEFWIQPTTLVGGVPIARQGLGNAWSVTYDTAGNWTATVYDVNGVKHSTVGASGSGAGGNHIQHIVLIYDSTTGLFALYVNGVNVTTSFVAPNANVVSNSSPIYLFSGGSANPSIQGYLDEVAFYNTALTDTQVRTHYAVGTGTPPPTPGVAASAANATAAAPVPGVTTGASNYRNVILNEPNLVGYWRLGEASGSALDSKGSNPGTISGAIARGVAGLIHLDPDNAASSDGSSGTRITVPYSGALNINWSSFAVECWVKAAASPAGVGWGIVSLGTPTPFWRIRAAFGVWDALVRGGNSQVAAVDTGSAGISVAIGLVRHLVLVYDSINAHAMTLYINGVAVATTGTQGPIAYDTTSPLVIFADASAAGSEFQGVVDEVAFYGAALSASQVQRHYVAGGPAIDAFAPAAVTTGIAPAPTDEVDSYAPAA